jgi:hypothetical protein
MVHLDVDAGNLQSVSLSVLLQLLSGAKQITLKMEMLISSVRSSHRRLQTQQIKFHIPLKGHGKQLDC